MRRKDSWRSNIIATSVLLALGSGPAMAQNRIDYELGVSLLHSDNIGLVPDNPKEDWVISPMLRFDVRRNSSNLRVAARGIAQYLDYTQGTFRNGARGALAAQVNWVISPGRLEFMAAEHLTRRPVDNFVSYNPTNEQQINVFVAGPTWVARISPSTYARFDLRASNSSAEKTHEIDGQQYLLSGSIGHDLSPNRSLSAVVAGEKTRYNKRSRSNDYSRDSAFARYTSRMRTIQLQTDLGWSRVEVPALDARASGPLVRIDATWKPWSGHSLQIGASQQYADTTQDVIATSLREQTVLIQDFLNAEGVVTPQVYRDRRASARYEYRAERLTFALELGLDRTTPVHTGGTGWRAITDNMTASYRLTPSWTANAVFADFRRRFDGQIGNDRNRLMGAGLGYRWSSHWSGRLDFQHRTRKTPIHIQGFTENGIVLYIAYQP